jgi:hypothetical protein
MSADLVATELEIALRQMLRRMRHRSRGHVEVSVTTASRPPVHAVASSDDAAYLLRDRVSRLLGRHLSTQGARWLLEAEDVIRIGRNIGPRPTQC